MERYKKLLENRLSKTRYKHSLGVAETAVLLAKKNGTDLEKAYLAGLLHDYAKEVDVEDILNIAETQMLIYDSLERRVPFLLHGVVGAYLIEKELGIEDEEILHSIRYHTTGCSQMPLLTQIIYIADMIEPTRSFPGIEHLRQTVDTNLQEGVLEGLSYSLKYVIAKKKLIHPLSIEAWNWLILNK